MIKPLLDTVSECKAQLLLVPAIVDGIQRKETLSPDNLAAWLKATEDILQKFGYAQCAEMAGLRARLLAPDFSESIRAARKKEKLRIAAHIVFDSQHVVSALITPLEEKIEEARSIVSQILLLVKPTGMLQFDGSVDFSNFLQGVWQTLRTNEQVGGGISKVLTLVSQSDALRILAEEIEIVD